MKNRTRSYTLMVPAHAQEWLLRGLLLMGSISLAAMLFAQGKLVDQRDQAQGWYLPVHGHVMIDGKNAEGYELMLYKDNQLIGPVKPGKKGRFELSLDIDQMYTLIVTKPGYEMKVIYIDASLPKDLVTYPDYECSLSLLPVNARNIDPFYTDFPGAIVRWNPEMGGFYHSEHYLSHIQTRLAGYATATF
ncbi:MAG: hypothetical protein ACK46G_08525 [Flavobacteriales bacterium]|jgi:hypothetical protein